MIKTDKNINISVGYQRFCMKPSEQGSFFQAGQNESKELYATIETYLFWRFHAEALISHWDIYVFVSLNFLG